MSHNQLKVNTKSPNIDGDITVNLSDIITINSANDGELLQKAASDWRTNKLSALSSRLLNYYDENSPGSLSYKYSLGDNYITRYYSGEYPVHEKVQFINAAGSYVPVSTATWTMAFYFTASDFPSGSQVLLRANVGATRSSSGVLTVQFYTASPYSSLTTGTSIGNKAYSTEDYGATAFGLYESTGSNTYVTLRVVNVTTNGVGITYGDIATIQQITAKQLK